MLAKNGAHTSAPMESKPKQRHAIRCAIYTRKSTDEGLDQEFNTLDAQREAGEAYIRSQRHEGWIPLPERYDDGGYTGANMDRPALKRLLGEIEAGRVDCVVVYKVDRLTRSLLDFARIIEVLDKSGTTFVSVTQQFNTTASLGRLTLNILLSFAQFEREMISERTRDKMSAARRKGKWTGGNLVLGYDRASKPGYIIVNQEEAARVREIFRLYLDYGAMLPVVEELNRRGWTMKSWVTREGRQTGGSAFTKNRLHSLLTNIIFTGRVKFESRIIEGEHDRIVDDETWNRVQELLHRNGRRGGRNLRNKHGALLKGIVRCASCDAGMTHTYTKKGNRLYRYYVCVRAQQLSWKECETRSVSAPALESAVVGQIRCISGNPTVRGEVLRRITDERNLRISELERERGALERDLSKLNRDVAAAALQAAEYHGGQIALDRLADLQKRASEAASRLEEVHHRITGAEANRVDLQDLENALENFDVLWEQLSIWEQEKFVRALVQEVRYDRQTGTVTLGFRSTVTRELCAWNASHAEEENHASS